MNIYAILEKVGDDILENELDIKIVLTTVMITCILVSCAWFLSSVVFVLVDTIDLNVYGAIATLAVLISSDTVLLFLIAHRLIKYNLNRPSQSYRQQLKWPTIIMMIGVIFTSAIFATTTRPNFGIPILILEYSNFFGSIIFGAIFNIFRLMIAIPLLISFSARLRSEYIIRYKM